MMTLRFAITLESQTGKFGWISHKLTDKALSLEFAV